MKVYGNCSARNRKYTNELYAVYLQLNLKKSLVISYSLRKNKCFTSMTND